MVFGVYCKNSQFTFSGQQVESFVFSFRPSGELKVFYLKKEINYSPQRIHFIELGQLLVLDCCHQVINQGIMDPDIIKFPIFFENR
jgi:hypothetical protein